MAASGYRSSYVQNAQEHTFYTSTMGECRSTHNPMRNDNRIEFDDFDIEFDDFDVESTSI